METTKRRKQVTLRITEELRERLNQEARKEHRSVNNLVEGILLDAMYYEPNEETIEAIEEARAGRYAGTIDLSSRKHLFGHAANEARPLQSSVQEGLQAIPASG